jgi:4-hydroxybenzoate polyprenyltransferase
LNIFFYYFPKITTLNFIYFIINSNIYISLAAVALTVATQLQLGMRPQWHPYLFIIFFATLFDYNLHRLITVLTNKSALDNEKHNWLKQYLNHFYGLMFFSAIGLFIALLLAKKEVIVSLAPLALITIFYTLPIFSNTKQIFRLREIPFLKIFLIASVWSASTIFLPIIQSGLVFDNIHIAWMFIERFCFIFAITIPFDIRDMAGDFQSGLKTIPLAIGAKKAIEVANISLLVFGVICLFHYYRTDNLFLLIAFLSSAISSVVVINVRYFRELTFYHYGILDGTMLLQGILTLLCWYMLR